MDNIEKLSKKNIDDRYVFAEYNTIKEEMNCMNRLQIYSLHVSVLASLTVIGVLSQLPKLDLFLFPIPFFIIFPSLFIIISRYQANMRLSGYLRTFLEKKSGFNYEKRSLKCLLIEKEPNLGKKKGVALQEMIFYLHLGFGILTIILFISKGFIPNINFWDATTNYIFIYISPLPFYWYVYKLIKEDWREIYDEYWEKVKNNEVKNIEKEKNNTDNNTKESLVLSDPEIGNNYIIAEYKTLREEILYHIKIRDQITIFFLTSAYIIMGYNIWKSGINIWLLYLPIITPFFAYIFYNLKSLYILKIDSYIRVVLERKVKEWNWHKMKYHYDIGIIFCFGKILSVLIFIIPICVSFYKILTIYPKIFHWFFLITISILILIAELSKYQNEKELDKRWYIKKRN